MFDMESQLLLADKAVNGLTVGTRKAPHAGVFGLQMFDHHQKVGGVDLAGITLVRQRQSVIDSRRCLAGRGDSRRGLWF